MSVRLEAVSVRHPSAGSTPRAALREVSLHVATGEQVAVVGPSGAGKTTLLHTAALALRPHSGRVLLGGQDPWTAGARRLRRLRVRLFLAPQVPPLPPRQRVVTAVLAGSLPAIDLARSVRSLFHPSDLRAAHEALRRFDLGERLFDRVDRLSGGERQRVSLARALLAPARLWLLDEPLSALDPARAAGALRVMREQAAERGATLLVSMHQIELALAHFPRVIGLRDGAVCFDGPAAQVTPEQLASLYATQPTEGQDEGAAPAAPEDAPPALLWR